MTGDSKRAHQSSRLRKTLGVALLLLLVIAGRLVDLQVVRAGTLSARAMKQWVRAIELPARRGTIYDRDGEPLALSLEAYDVYATPYQVREPAETARALASVLGEKDGDWQGKLMKEGGFVWLARRVDVRRARRLKEMKLAGIGFIASSRRSYRLATVAGQVVGLSGVDDQGLAGLELYYDGTLGGAPGTLEAERDPLGRILPGGLVRQIEPRDGQSLRITLDSDIQYKAQRELQIAVKETGAKGGTIIVLVPASGEILAMASWPFVDPTKLSTLDSMTGMRNRAVTDVFEPGSTMKIVTVAAALEERLVRPTKRFVLPSTLTVGGHTVHEAHDRGTEVMTVADILAKSSNVGAVTLGLRLGKEDLYSYIERFGFTRRTGVDYPGESVGWVPPPEEWSRSSISTIPFGQGISATPLQMAQVMSTVANGGVAMPPHLLASRVGTESPAPRGRRIISARTAAMLRGMLTRAVTYGTGQSARIPGYTVAGKTGTAQKAKEGARGYKEDAYLASFIGFAPARRPRLVCLVALDEPVKGHYGGTVAAPVFAGVVRFALGHLKVAPDDADRKARPGTEARR